MEKVSGILASNARIESVDLDSAKPVRKGTPGRTPTSNKNTRLPGAGLSAMERISLSPEAMATIDPNAARRLKIAENMAKDFFNTNYDNSAKQKQSVELPKLNQSQITTSEPKPYKTETVVVPKALEPVYLTENDVPEKVEFNPSEALDKDYELNALKQEVQELEMALKPSNITHLKPLEGSKPSQEVQANDSEFLSAPDTPDEGDTLDVYA